MLKKITNNIVYVGCDDHEIDLFEGQYPVKNGISYNSYVIVDEKIAVMDTIDKSKTETYKHNRKSQKNLEILNLKKMSSEIIEISTCSYSHERI